MGKSLPTKVQSQPSKKSRKKSTKAAVVVSEDSNTATSKNESITPDSPTKSSGPDGIDTETLFENKKAQKRAIRAARHRKPAEDDASASLEGVKNGKKRKDRTDDEEGDAKNAAASTEEPPKKKHKNRTEFADPRYDELLNPQSRKALEYAFIQMNKPSKWKFNKARQNWLIRNIWAPELLPENYIPLVWKYLGNIQGGSKQKLIETCQSYLKVEEKTETKIDTETETGIETTDTTSAPAIKSSSAPPPPPLKSILKPTPGPLIAPGPLVDVPSTSAPESGDAAVADAKVPTESVLSPAALAEIRRTRARGLLEILSSS